MDNNKIKISSLQLGILIVVTIMGVGILAVPRIVVQDVGSDGWLLILIGGGFSLIAAMIIHALGSRFPNKQFFDYTTELIGKPLASIVVIVYTLYFIPICAFIIRIFGEVLKMYLLPRTPIEVIIITFLLALAYLIRQGLEAIVRFYEIMLFLMIIPFLLSLLAGTYKADYTNLLPVFQSSPLDMMKSSLQLFLSFLGFESALLFIPYVADHKNTKKSMIIAISFVTVIYLFTTMLVISTFGVDETGQLIWPLMSYVKAIEVPGSFIEQLEGIIMTIWVFFAYTTSSTLYFSGSITLSKLTGVKDYRVYVMLILPIIYILALLPGNIAEVYDWDSRVSIYLGATVAFIIPLLLLVVSILRKKGEKTHG